MKVKFKYIINFLSLLFFSISVFSQKEQDRILTIREYYNTDDKILLHQEFDSSNVLTYSAKYSYNSMKDTLLKETCSSLELLKKYGELSKDINTIETKLVHTEFYEVYEYIKCYDSQEQLIKEISWNRSSEPLYKKEYSSNKQGDVIKVLTYEYNEQKIFELISTEERKYTP